MKISAIFAVAFGSLAAYAGQMTGLWPQWARQVSWAAPVLCGVLSGVGLRLSKAVDVERAPARKARPQRAADKLRELNVENLSLR